MMWGCTGRTLTEMVSLHSKDPCRAVGVGDNDQYADFDDVYRDNIVRVYRFLYRNVGNRADAEDLTADVFLAVMGPLRVTADRAEVRAYLFAAARTIMAGFWRRRLGAEAATAGLVAAMPRADDSFPESDAPRRAADLLAELPHRYRRILELRFLESRSIKDAAQAMNVSVANAKVLQHRGLAMAAAGLASAAS